jgi:hypothetical protein
VRSQISVGEGVHRSDLRPGPPLGSSVVARRCMCASCSGGPRDIHQHQSGGGPGVDLSLVFRPLDPGRTGVGVYPGVPHMLWGVLGQMVLGNLREPLSQRHPEVFFWPSVFLEAWGTKAKQPHELQPHPGPLGKPGGPRFDRKPKVFDLFPPPSPIVF